MTAQSPHTNDAAAALRALLIIGHGTEEPRGRAEFARLVEQVARRAPQTLVEGCFLELSAPDIASGFDRLYARRAREVTVAPLLLFAAGHAKRDIPQQIAAARARLRGLNVRQADCLNCAAPLVALSSARYRAALAGRAEVASEQTLLLFVGRGSHDAEATAEIRRIALLRQAQTPVGAVEICFLAMARPSLEESLERILQTQAARIVVQPHLLFAGKLADRIAVQVAAAAAAVPDKELIVVEPLGAEELLVEAVLERASAAHTVPLR